MARKARVFRDPDVRQQCSYCQGPVYYDEPSGNACPDCRVVLNDLKAITRATAPPAAPHNIKVCKMLFEGGREGD